MLQWLVPLVPLPYFLASAAVAIGMLNGRIHGEAGETVTSRLVVGAGVISFLLAGCAGLLRAFGLIPSHIVLGIWLESGDYRIEASFLSDGLSLGLALLFALLSWMTLRFSVNYMHRESGFHRFFLVMSLFAAAMLWLVLAGNAAFTFIGWELAGVCSYLLIAYLYQRPIPAANATRAFVTNRVGDAGFMLGIFVAYTWTGGIEWPELLAKGARLEPLATGALAACFLLAAVAKSAQLPLSPWLARAMEGPTPSSAIFYGAVMVHAGVYLVLRLEPVFTQSPGVMALLAGIGFLTAVYGYACGLVQTDVKSALIFSTTAQVGLMFLECGLGWWQMGAWHLATHAVMRAYQFLSAPSLMHSVLGLPPRPISPFLACRPGLHVAALQRFWLEDCADALLVRPIQGYASDLDTFDHRVVDPLVGLSAPTMRELSSLAEWEESRLGGGDGRPQARGLLGHLIHSVADLLYWFEQRLVLEGVGRNLFLSGRRLGARLNLIEAALGNPRYPTLLVLLTLIAYL